MLILLYGVDTYRSRQKLEEIISGYRAKHKTGLGFIFFREEMLDLDKIKEAIETISMFDSKKLIILENVFKHKTFSEEFLKYALKNKLKNNQDIILVIHQKDKLVVSGLKAKLNMIEEFNSLDGLKLVSWIKAEVAKRGGQIDFEAVNRLSQYVSGDLWQMSNEIDKLISYKNKGLIKADDVEEMVRAKVDLNIFKMLDAVSSRNKKEAFKLLHNYLENGKSELYLLTMFVYQLRILIRLKDLIERGAPYYSLSKATGLHPFVVKKSTEPLRAFTLEKLKKIYSRLLEIDLGLKTGRFDGRAALDMLVGEI